MIRVPSPRFVNVVPCCLAGQLVRLIFLFGGAGREEPWGSLTCGRLLEMAEIVQAKIKAGKESGGGGGGGLQFEKLTHGFWRRYIRREVLRAGGKREMSAHNAFFSRGAGPFAFEGLAYSVLQHTVLRKDHKSQAA